MSVYIPNMEMPKSCFKCPCSGISVGEYDENVCYLMLTGEEYGECPSSFWKTIEDVESRPDWCPLKEIPPHGRLIDADALKTYETESWDYPNNDSISRTTRLAVAGFIQDIDNSSTVIEPDK